MIITRQDIAKCTSSFVDERQLGVGNRQLDGQAELGAKKEKGNATRQCLSWCASMTLSLRHFLSCLAFTSNKTTHSVVQHSCSFLKIT